MTLSIVRFLVVIHSDVSSNIPQKAVSQVTDNFVNLLAHILRIDFIKPNVEEGSFMLK